MPDWSQDLRNRLADLRLDGAREAEIVEELSQHLDDRYEELCAAGATDMDARCITLGELDEAGGLGERLLSLAQPRTPVSLPAGPDGGLLHGTWQDLRYAVRALRLQPGFAAIVVGTLALGIAVNTLTFTIVNAAVLRPLPFEDPDQLVRLSVANDDAQNPVTNPSYLEVLDWQQARRTFEHIAVLAERRMDLSGDGRPPVRVAMAFASWNLVDLLRQRPALGRAFTSADDRPGAPPVVLIGSDLWRTRYQSDRNVLGTTVRIDGTPATVIGVMPPGFGFPDRMELWLPAAALPEAERASRQTSRVNAVGRMRPGITIDQAQAELAGIEAVLAERHPDTNRGVRARVAPAAIASEIIRVLIALLGAVGFVLLIACANVANLLLARAGERSRDVTLRVALGASRWRIVRQLLAESLLLASAGGLAGLALSHAGLQLFIANVGAEAAPPSWVEFTLDRTVFAYLAALCVGSALVCGLVPAWHASRPDLAAAISDATRSDTGSRFRHRWTGAFVVAQVTLALVLLTGAALTARSVVDVMRTDVGVETDTLFQTAFNLRRADYTPERRLLFVQELDQRFASRRGIQAALTSNPPMEGALIRRVQIDGQPESDVNALPPVSLVVIGSTYFDVLGAPIISGRVLDAGDLRQPGKRVVVNERFARIYLGEGPAVGRRIRLLPPNQTPGNGETTTQWATVIGVVANVRQRMLPSGDFDPVVYRAYGEDPPSVVEILVRSASEPGAVLTFLGEQVQALDPDLPLFPFLTVEDALAQQFWPQRVFGSLFGVFAVIALLMAACGLYGVTSYAVSRRTREIGIRVALGADAGRVWWAITGRTLRQLAIGVVLGTAGAAAVASVLPAMLVGTSAVSPLVFGLVIVVLIAVGVGASAIPARRALRVDAVEALRAE
jgi:putative ABC transport system permease protein